MSSPTYNKRMQPFGVSIFSEMSRLAIEHQAINLSQGFPDFDGPAPVKEAAIRAIRAGKNQYVPSHGARSLRQALARNNARRYGLEHDPESEITVYSGATEAIFSTIMALVEPGDEVICLEPFYDSYAPSIVMAGGTPRFVQLEFPDFALPQAELEAAFNDRTRLLILNTPQNPTGKMFDRDELGAIAALCRKHDVLVMTDEVYEYLTFDDNRHIPMASIDGMRDRTVMISSTAKTFSLTGWKVGYSFASAEVSSAIRLSHQFITFCTAPPFQEAMAEAFDTLDDYLPQLTSEYAERRDLLYQILGDAGFRMGPKPAGSYFVLADFTPFGFDDDRAFCEFLTTEIGVAAVPPSYFYSERRGGRNLARFAFCKETATLEAAAERLMLLKDRV